MNTLQPILKLRPTQLAVGMLEVDEKIALLKASSKKRLKKHISETPIPVVRAPNGELYVIDRHHFLCVCYHLGLKKVKVEVTKDWKDTKMTYRQFWDRMEKSRSIYLYCQFGNGPHREFYLPKDIRGLADDPYRSLAWFVRKAGAFKNSEKNFAEFHWANYFRSKKLLNRYGMAGFPKALKKAIMLAQSAEAGALPGFGLLNFEEKIKVEKKGLRTMKKYRQRFHERAIIAEPTA